MIKKKKIVDCILYAKQVELPTMKGLHTIHCPIQ